MELLCRTNRTQLSRLPEVFHLCLIKNVDSKTVTCYHTTPSSLSSTTQNKSGEKLVDQVSIVPHPVTKLRFFKYAIWPDETEYEKKFREKRYKVQARNFEYWSYINTSFNENKKKYIENELQNNPEHDFTAQQSFEELGQFYKKFLDDNRERHIQYNFEWYRNNLSLLWPAFVVWLIRKKRLLKQSLGFMKK